MLSHVKARGSWLILLIVVLTLLISTSVAQVIDGSISGAVKDSSGAYISKATITVSAADIGVTRTTTTTSDGHFVIPALPKGNYTVSVTAEGFKKLQKTNIPLGNGDRVSVGDLTLQVGGADTSITVEADQGQVQIQANSGERSDTLTSKDLNDLATNGRMMLDYVKILPGVVSTFNGAQSSKGGLGNINVNGARGTSTAVTIDGITNIDNGCNCATQVTINPDAISEMKVLTSNYQAEYGKVAGAQIAVATKNGTNQLHGNVRWFHRNEGMNANEWFNDQANSIAEQQGKADPNPKQKYRYNYFGFSVGGPIIIPKTGINKNKDKLYFFFNQEYYRQLLPGGYSNVYVPTAAEINGDFSKSTDGYGKPLTVIDPTTGQPFTGNVIPSNRINTAVQQYMLKVLPRPNATDNETCSGSSLPGSACNHYNYITSLTTTHPRREDIGRLDYQINSSNRLFFTVVNNSGQQFLPEGLSPQGISNFQFPGGMFLQEPGYNVSSHLTSNLSTTLINELTFGVDVNQQHIYAVNDLTNANYNLNIPLMYPVAGTTAIPDMSFGGINGQSGTWSYLGSVPWRNADTVINFSDNLTKMIGKHTLKAGIFIERNRKDQSSWGNANGTFSFNTDNKNPVQTTDPYANALLGSFSSFQQQNGRVRGFYRYTNLEFFLQDNFKVTHRLTLDYGMRFAWVQPQFDAQNQLSYFDPTKWDPSQAARLYKRYPDGSGRAYDPVTGNIVNGSLYGDIVPGTGNPYNGMVVAGDAGYMPGGFKDRGLMLEPRFGFAFDVFGNGKTVLRGGAGMTHDRFQGNPIYNLVVGNPPLSADPTYSYGTLANISSMAGTNALAPASPVGFDPSGKVPTVYSYSLGIQHDLGWGTVLDIAYVGNQSRHLSQKYNLNAIPYNTLFTAAAQDPAKYVNNGYTVTPETWGTAWVNAGYQYTGDNAYDANFLRKYMGYGDIQYWTWDGDANYNSLQIQAKKQVRRGLTFTAAYTWSKAMDTSNADGDWTNIINPKVYNYTLASFDRPHVLALSYVYDLPKLSKRLGGSKFLSYLLDNYQLEGITQFLNGGPGTVGGNFSFPWGGGYSQMLDGSWTEPTPIYVNGNPTAKTSDPYSHLNPAAFVMPQIGTPAPWSQNYFRSGGTNNSDMSLFKNIPLGSNESRYIQLGVEAYNVFNHPQFWGINTGTGQANINGDTNPWGNWPNGMFTNNYSQAVPINYSQVVRPAGKTGNVGQYFGEYNGGGNARVLQLRMKIYF